MSEPELACVVLDIDDLFRRIDVPAPSSEDRAVLRAGVTKLAHLTRELAHRDVTIARLRYIVFGPKTEKMRAGKRAEEEATDTAAADAGVKTSPQRKGHGRRPASAYTGAEQHQCKLATLCAGQACPVCERGKLHSIEPQSIVRLHGSVPVAAKLYLCEQVRCGLCGEVFTAPPPEDAGPEKYDDYTRAILALLKYGTGMPYYRLSQLQLNAGVPLAASVQWRLNIETATWLMPLYDAFVQLAAQGRLMHNDDTGALILGPVKRRKAAHVPGLALVPSAGMLRAGADDARPNERTGTFTTGVVSFVGDHRVVLYMTGWRHAGENFADVLARRAANAPPPIQMCDALSRNLPSALRTIVANCLAHGRREFVQVKLRFPEECEHVIGELAKVYHNDELARRRRMSDEERLDWHQAESAPVMTALATWMQQQLDARLVEENSALGKAIQYMLKHWQKLTLFLRVAGAPLDNTECERALKLAVLHRKNAMFFRTQRGAVVADIFMSLIRTATLAGKNPFHYLVTLIARRTHVREAPERWMPWNYEETLATLDTAAAA